MFDSKCRSIVTGCLALAGVLSAGCSVTHTSGKAAAKLFAASAQSFATDDDPELIADASAFALKLTETLILTRPDDRDLLLSACRGFAQYAFAFAQQRADELEEKNFELAQHYVQRARKLYRRAVIYGWRALEADYPNVQGALRKDMPLAIGKFKRADVPSLYWTALALGALINLSKDNAELVADVPVMESLIDRALELDESYESGAIHNFLIAYEMQRRNRKGDPVALAREHFYRAVELTRGKMASSFVTLAEAVSVKRQDRTEFQQLLNTALKIDPDSAPQWRLANLLWQQRARWLLGRENLLFSE